MPAWGWLWPLALVVVLFSSGCPGDGSELEMTGGAGIEPTLASIQARVFSPICSECHYPAGPGPMPLDTEDASYANLVGVDALCPVGLRVAPGDPDASYLVAKIEGRAGICGDRMPPPPASLLTVEQIDAMRQWVADGAPR